MINLTYAISLWNYIHYKNIPDLKEILAGLRRFGYGVELWNSRIVDLDLFDPEVRKNLGSWLDGMPVSLHTDIGFNSRDFHARQIEAAADLGAPVLVLHSDNLYIDNTKQLDVDLAKYVVEYASSRGIRIALENGQLPFLADAIERVPGLDICLDVGHVYLTDEPMSAFLDALKDRIIHLHIQEILSGPEKMLLNEGGIIIDHYTPGTGGIPEEDWLLLFETLKGVNYQGMAVFEIQPRKPLQTAALGKLFVNGFL
jgi:sugar phosphate isomerase/epimerase